MKVKIATLFVLFIFYSITIYGQAGSLDVDFSGDGMQITNFGDYDAGYSVVIQADGKIEVVGKTTSWFSPHITNIALVRYNNDGSLDTSFGYYGRLTTHVSYYAIANSAVIQADGKILVAGNTDYYTSNLVLLRYNTDGSIDSTFGNYGIVVSYSEGYGEGGTDIALQEDEKIVVAGYRYKDIVNSSLDFVLLRYLTNGTLDSTFGDNGRVVTDFAGYKDYAASVVIQENGKIVVGGYSTNGTDIDFALVRYNIDGSPDNSFGTNGKLTTDFGGNQDYGSSVVLQVDKKIVVAGYSYNGTDRDFALARYNIDGSLDNSFGTNGKLITDFAGYDDYGTSVALQEDGKIVVAGKSSDGTSAGFALVRYNIDGSIDSSFGNNGFIITDFGVGGFAFGKSIAMQVDGKIVVAGFVGYDFAVARYLSGLNVGLVDLSAQNKIALIYPNPIGESATLEYTLAQDEIISIELYDVSGKLFDSFITQESRLKGTHKEIINFNRPIPSGYYLLKLSSYSGSLTIKIIKQ